MTPAFAWALCLMGAVVIASIVLTGAGRAKADFTIDDLKAPRAATPLYRQPVSYAPGKVFGKAGATEADITYSDRFGTTNIRPFTPALPPPASAGSSSPRFAGSPRSTPLHPYTNSRAQQQAASIFAPRLLATPRSDIAATSWLQGRSWPPAGTGRDETRRALQRKPRPEF